MDNKDCRCGCKRDVTVVESIFDIADIMIDDLDCNERISLMAKGDDAVQAMAYIINEYNAKLDFADFESEREDTVSGPEGTAYVSLRRYKDDVYVSISPAYNSSKDAYYGIDGLVFIHRNFADKAVKDIFGNELIHDFCPVIFCFDDEKDTAEGKGCTKYEKCIHRKDETHDVNYTISKEMSELIKEIGELLQTIKACGFC